MNRFQFVEKVISLRSRLMPLRRRLRNSRSLLWRCSWQQLAGSKIWTRGYECWTLLDIEIPLNPLNIFLNHGTDIPYSWQNSPQKLAAFIISKNFLSILWARPCWTASTSNLWHARFCELQLSGREGFCGKDGLKVWVWSWPFTKIRPVFQSFPTKL